MEIFDEIEEFRRHPPEKVAAKEAFRLFLRRTRLKASEKQELANLVVDVYDVDQSNNATLISRNTMLVNQSGNVSLPLYGDDWIVKRHHRVGV